MKEKLLPTDEAKARIDEIFDSLDDYDRLTDRQRHVWVVWWFYTLVENGGMNAFFVSDVADHTAFLLESLGKIGAVVSQAYLRRCCRLFSAGRPDPEYEIRKKQVQEIIARTGRIHPWYDPEFGANFVNCEVEVEGTKENLFGLLLRYWENEK